MVARSGNSAGAGYMNVIINTLTADMINTGYVLMAQNNLVSNGTNTSNSIQWNILKSPGGNNAIGNDWFVALGTDLPTNTWLWATLFCGWNVGGTNQASQFIPSNTGGGGFPNFNICANGFANTSVTANALTPGNVWCLNGGGTLSIQTTGNGCNYIYTTTIDRTIISIANTAAANMNTNVWCYYLGTYDSFMPLSRDPYPLVMGNIAVVAGSGNPALPPTNSGSPSEPYGIQFPFGPIQQNFATTIPAALTGYPIQGYDIYQGGSGPRPVKILIGGRGGASQLISSATGLGGIRGVLKDCWAVGNTGNTTTSTIYAHTDVLYFTASGIQYNLTYLGYGANKTNCAPTPGPLTAGQSDAYYPWVNLL